MENKKSVVTVARLIGDVSKDGKNNFRHGLEFANGDKGNFFYKSITLPFKTGDEIEYNIGTNDKGFTNITLPSEKKGFPGRAAADPKFENRRVALRCAVDVLNSGREIPTVKLSTLYKRFLSWLENPDDAN